MVLGAPDGSEITGSGPTFTFTPAAAGKDIVILSATSRPGATGYASAAVAAVGPSGTLGLTVPDNLADGVTYNLVGAVPAPAQESPTVSSGR